MTACRVVRWALSLPVLVLCAPGTWAQNLLANPTFDSDRDAWSEGGPRGTLARFHHTASQGFPASGAAAGVNSSPLADFSIPLLSQPVGVPFGQPVRFGGYCLIPEGQARSGGCVVGVSFYGSAGQLLQSALAGFATEPGTWTSVAAAVPFDPPIGTTSASLFFRVYKHEAGGEFVAYVDDAYLGPTGTKGDLDGDGKVDLILHSTDGENRVWRMDGVTRSSTTLIDAPGLLAIAGSDDFDLDGRSDLVSRDFFTGSIYFWMMDGAHALGGAALGSTPLPAANWYVVATGDFNHDGRPDLLWRNIATQGLLVWTLSGTTPSGTLTPTPNSAVDANWSVAAALDFDNDGNRDLLWYNATSGKIVLWRMDANLVRTAGEFTNPANAGDNNWQVRAGGDYGLGPGGVAGSNDIVWRNASSGKFVVWHMDPSSVPLTRTSGEFTNPDGPTSNPTDWTIVGPK